MTYDPPESVRQWAQQSGYGKTYKAHLEFFNDYLACRGRKYKDLDAAFRNCLRADWGGIRAATMRHNGGHPQVSTIQPVKQEQPKLDENRVPMPAAVREKLRTLLGKVTVK